jgi:hypothetical protein
VPFDSEPGDNFSVEFAVQCLTGDPCKGYLGHQVRDDGSFVSVRRTPKFTVPNDGKWYVCRFDWTFKTTNDGANTTATEYPGNQIRVLLGNGKEGTQLRIDAMAVYGHMTYGSDNQEPHRDLKQCNRYVEPEVWWD